MGRHHLVFLVYQVSYRLFSDENENMPKHEMERCSRMWHLFSDAFVVKRATASGAAKDNLCYLHKTEKLRHQSSDLSQHEAYLKNFQFPRLLPSVCFETSEASKTAAMGYALISPKWRQCTCTVQSGWWRSGLPLWCLVLLTQLEDSWWKEILVWLPVPCLFS